MKNHIVLTGLSFTELTSQLSAQVLKPNLASVFSSKVTPGDTLPDNLEGYYGHTRFAGSFLSGGEFDVLVKNASNEDDILSRLIQNNIDSFDYQLALGNVMKGVE